MPVYPVYSLDYRRPGYVPPSSPTPSDESTREGSQDDILKTMPLTPKGIPEALSFDRVINGGCCPVSSSPHPHHSLTAPAAHEARVPQLPQVLRALSREPAVLPLVQGLREALRSPARSRASPRPGLDRRADRGRAPHLRAEEEARRSRRRRRRRREGAVPRHRLRGGGPAAHRAGPQLRRAGCLGRGPRRPVGDDGLRSWIGGRRLEARRTVGQRREAPDEQLQLARRPVLRIKLLRQGEQHL